MQPASRPTNPPSRFDWNSVVTAREYEVGRHGSSSPRNGTAMGGGNSSYMKSLAAAGSSSPQRSSSSSYQQQQQRQPDGGNSFIPRYRFGEDVGGDTDWRGSPAGRGSYPINTAASSVLPKNIGTQQQQQQRASLQGVQHPKEQQQHELDGEQAHFRPRSSTLPFQPVQQMPSPSYNINNSSHPHSSQQPSSSPQRRPGEWAAPSASPSAASGHGVESSELRPMRPSDMLVPQRVSSLQGAVSFGGGGGYRSNSQQAASSTVAPPQRSSSLAHFSNTPSHHIQQHKRSYSAGNTRPQALPDSNVFYSSHTMHLSPPTRNATNITSTGHAISNSNATHVDQGAPRGGSSPARGHSPSVSFDHTTMTRQQHSPGLTGGSPRQQYPSGGRSVSPSRNQQEQLMRSGLTQEDFQSNVSGPGSSHNLSNLSLTAATRSPSNAKDGAGVSRTGSTTTGIVSNGINPNDLFRRSTSDMSRASLLPGAEVNATALPVNLPPYLATSGGGIQGSTVNSSTRLNRSAEAARNQQPPQSGVRAESITPEAHDSSSLIPNVNTQTESAKHMSAGEPREGAAPDFGTGHAVNSTDVAVAHSTPLVRDLLPSDSTAFGPVLDSYPATPGSSIAPWRDGGNLALARGPVFPLNFHEEPVTQNNSVSAVLPRALSGMPQTVHQLPSHFRQGSAESNIIVTHPTRASPPSVGGAQAIPDGGVRGGGDHRAPSVAYGGGMSSGIVQSPRPAATGPIRVIVENHSVPRGQPSGNANQPPQPHQVGDMQMVERIRQQVEEEHDQFDQRRLLIIRHLEGELKRKDAEIMQLRLALNRHYITSVSMAGYASRLKFKAEHGVAATGDGAHSVATPSLQRVQSMTGVGEGHPDEEDPNPDREVRIDMTNSSGGAHGANQLITGAARRRGMVPPVIPPHVAGLPLAPIPYSRHPGSVKGSVASHMSGFLWIFDTCLSGNVGAPEETAANSSTGIFGGVFKKKNKPHRSSGKWVLLFVVADDRGVSLYTSQEDFKALSYHRCRVHCPFSSCEYFVPRFSNAPNTVLSAADADPKNTKLTRTSSTIDVNADVGLKPVFNAEADDANGVHFGFVPLQPMGSSNANPPNPTILFRTTSHQEYQDWSHFFAMNFNRKLYREMFPMLYLTSLDGDTVFTVSEGTSTHDLETVMKPINDLQRQIEAARHEEEEKRLIAEQTSAEALARREQEENDRAAEQEKMVSEIVEEELAHRTAQIYEDVKHELIEGYERHKQQLADECSIACQTDMELYVVQSAPTSSINGGRSRSSVTGDVANQSIVDSTGLVFSPLNLGSDVPSSDAGPLVMFSPTDATAATKQSPLGTSQSDGPHLTRQPTVVGIETGNLAKDGSISLQFPSASFKDGSTQYFSGPMKDISTTTDLRIQAAADDEPKSLSPVEVAVREREGLLGTADAATASPTPNQENNVGVTGTKWGGTSPTDSFPHGVSSVMPHRQTSTSEYTADEFDAAERLLREQRERELHERTQERNAAVEQAGSLKELLLQSQSAVKELSNQLRSMEVEVAAAQAKSAGKSPQTPDENTIPPSATILPAVAAPTRKLVSPDRDNSVFDPHAGDDLRAREGAAVGESSSLSALRSQVASLLDHCNDLEEELRESRTEQERLKSRTAQLKEDYGRKVRELCERAAKDMLEVTASANRTIVMANNQALEAAARSNTREHRADDDDSDTSQSSQQQSTHRRHPHDLVDPGEACAISLFVTRGGAGRRTDFDLRCDMDAGTMSLEGSNRLDSDSVGFGDGSGREEYLFCDSATGFVPRQVRHGWAFKDLMSSTVVVVDLQCFPEGLYPPPSYASGSRIPHSAGGNRSPQRQSKGEVPRLHPLWATTISAANATSPPRHPPSHARPAQNVLYAPSPSMHRHSRHIGGYDESNASESGGVHTRDAEDACNDSYLPPNHPASKNALRPLRPARPSTSSMIDVKRMLLNPPPIPARGNKAAKLRERTSSVERRKLEAQEQFLEQQLDHDTTAWHKGLVNSGTGVLHASLSRPNTVGAASTSALQQRSNSSAATPLPISGRAVFGASATNMDGRAASLLLSHQDRHRQEGSSARKIQVEQLASSFLDSVKKGFSSLGKTSTPNRVQQAAPRDHITLEDLTENGDRSVIMRESDVDSTSSMGGVEHYYDLLRESASKFSSSKSRSARRQDMMSAQDLLTEEVGFSPSHTEESHYNLQRRSPSVHHVHHFI